MITDEKIKKKLNNCEKLKNNPEIKNLLIKMLKVNSSSRPKIDDVLLDLLRLWGKNYKIAFNYSKFLLFLLIPFLITQAQSLGC